MKSTYIKPLILFYMGYTMLTQAKIGEQTKQENNIYYLGSITKPISPETTIFAFDLHDVLFVKKLGERVGCCLRTLPKGMVFYVLNPFFWYEVRKISNQTAIWEDFFYQLVEKYPGLSNFEQDFHDVANAYEPIAEMVDVISELKNKGYTLYILSNIGGKTFELFKKKFPDLFKYFCGAYTPCKENNYNCKPNITFYQEFKQFIAHKDRDKQCIFIDDLEENLQAALASNKFDQKVIMGGIHCSSVDRVKKVLLDHGVLIPSEKAEVKVLTA